MSKDITITVTEPQAAFHELQCRYPAFIAGYGSGKSEALVNQALFIDAAQGPDAIVGLYAPTFDNIRLNLWPRVIAKLEEHGIEYKANKSDFVINIQHPQMGSLIFRSLNNPERIVGYETFRAHVDELDTLPTDKAEDVWNKIISRNRQTISDKLPNRVAAYTTPEGFKFCYKMWSQNSHSSGDYKMVRAPSYSNPYLPTDYIDSLRNTYPGELVEAYIEGHFVNLTAGTVYNSFNRELHDSNESIRDNEPLFIGCDFNVTQQAATVYVRRNGGLQWHAVDELVEMYDTPDMIDIIKQRYPTNKIIIYPDASGGSRKSVNASTSDIALLKQAGFEVRAKKSNPLVKDRVIATNRAFSEGLLFINASKCPTVVRCLEQQSYNKNGEPDKQSGHDHQNDATTYPIAYEMPVRKPVVDMPISFQL